MNEWWKRAPGVTRHRNSSRRAKPRDGGAPEGCGESGGYEAPHWHRGSARWRWGDTRRHRQRVRWGEAPSRARAKEGETRDRLGTGKGEKGRKEKEEKGELFRFLTTSERRRLSVHPTCDS